jgi:hypothetical protein
MWKKTRTHVSLIDQHQSNNKQNSMLENSEAMGDLLNGQTNGKKRANGDFSENEDSIDNNGNQQNKNNQENFEEDADENEEDDDGNFNVSFTQIL